MDFLTTLKDIAIEGVNGMSTDLQTVVVAMLLIIIMIAGFSIIRAALVGDLKDYRENRFDPNGDDEP